MDEQHLLAALRYVAMNPVRAGLVQRASDWPWSAARAQLGLEQDPIANVAAVRERVPDFAEMLSAAEDEEATRRLRQAESIGRPLGTAQFVAGLERGYNRKLAPARRGRKPKEEISALSP